MSVYVDEGSYSKSVFGGSISGGSSVNILLLQPQE